MALELAKHNSVYEDIASKFFEVILYNIHRRNPSRVPSALHLHCRRHDL